MWEVMRRIWKDDPDAEITGDALRQGAAETNLTVVSVYGGDETHARHATRSTRRPTR